METNVELFQHNLAQVITRKRIQAHAKHGVKSIEMTSNFDRFNTILVEEVGEVAMAINDAIVKGWPRGVELNAIRSELLDVITVASAWLHTIDDEAMVLGITVVDAS